MNKGGRAKRGLGKGLNQLMGNIDEEYSETLSGEISEASSPDSLGHAAGETSGGEVYLRLSEIDANEGQPRKQFGEEELKELTESVRQYGILQPILVQREKDRYRIIAGERRFRAAKNAGLKEIPVIIRNYSTQQAAEVAIIENVQRTDLNPIEEALAYQTLIEEYGLKQEEVAGRVSKNRTTIANALRLLKLSAPVRQLLAEGKISAGHARALLSLEDEKLQLELAGEIIEKVLSVRETEKAAKQLLKRKQREGEKQEEEVVQEEQYDIFFQNYEEYMRSILGTKVHINRRDRNKGRIEIDYYSAAELERIMELIKSIRS